LTELSRIGPVGREAAPRRAPALPADPAREAGRAVVPVAAARRPAAEDGAAGHAAARWTRDPRAAPSASAAFLAQALAQGAPEPPAALRHGAADRAYRDAAGLRVEFLGFGAPVDLRV
jgi:hypothetical protein